MSFKAKLKVVLQADETVVAESDDAGLWQNVLMAINAGSSVISADKPPSGDSAAKILPPKSSTSADAVGRFADTLGVSRELVVGACSPQTESPFLHLDKRCWESMKENTGQRGPSAYSPIAVASTLLVLWFEAAQLGAVTQAQAQTVLGTIGVRDANAARGIDRSDWLQARPGNTVIINAAKYSRAKAVAKSFCSMNWAKDAE